MMSPMTKQPQVVEVATLGEHATAWDEIVAAMSLPSPFLRSWWLSSVAEQTATFLLVWRGDHLTGGLPLRRDAVLGVPVYRFCGTGTLCPDHLDLVSAPQDLAMVGAAIRDWFIRPGTRALDLNGVADGSPLKQLLPGARSRPIDVAPWQPLPADPAQYLAERSPAFRKTVRRARNHFARAGLTMRAVEPGQLDAALAEFAALHTARGDRGALLVELPRLRTALAAGLPTGEARVDVLADDAHTVAVSIAFASCGRLSLYQGARDMAVDNATTIVDVAVIQRACAEGFAEVDILRGAEAYKLRLAGELRRLRRVRAAHGLPARAVLGLLDARAVAGRILRWPRGITARRSAPAGPDA